MKVAIFETEHFEAAYPLIKLFDDGKNEITVFTNADCYRQLQFLLKGQLTRYHWVVRHPRDSKYIFMRRMYSEIKKKKIELLFLNTVNDNFIFYAVMVAFLKRTRIILTLHDINTFFHHKFKFSLRRWVRITGKKALVSLIKEFNVISLTMVDYVKSKLPGHKKVHCVPGAVFQETLATVKHTGLQEMNIVVPGSIDQRRRDYHQVFELLKIAEEENLKVTLVILGGPYEQYGYDVIEQCKHYVKTRNNLVFYQEKVVDQPEFDRQLNLAHFVFIPSVIHTMISDDIPETYGQSKSSGNVFDIIKHAKPFIAPIDLKVDPFLELSCIRYHRVDEIIKTLVEIRKDPQSYSDLKQSAYEASRNYTIEAIRKRNPALFDR
jgi:glycosyltransferase involved in cell wall biosynthesis